MSLSTTIAAPRHPRLARIAAVATVTCAIAGAAVIVTSDDRPARQATPAAQSVGGFHDLQANKAVAMRALGRHLGAQRTSPGPRYLDLEANKARSNRAR